MQLGLPNNIVFQSPSYESKRTSCEYAGQFSKCHFSLFSDFQRSSFVYQLQTYKTFAELRMAPQKFFQISRCSTQHRGRHQMQHLW